MIIMKLCYVEFSQKLKTIDTVCSEKKGYWKYKIPRDEAETLTPL